MATHVLHPSSLDQRKSVWSSFYPGSRKITLVTIVALLLLGGLCSDAIAEDQDLISLSLEELLNVEVTSVSKKPEKRTGAAAAIYVLSEEDIRRSGARTLPDLLRTVPGIHVGQLTGNKWSVTSRGFGGRFANKLLVLIDGRSIYTQQFSGVLWEMHDIRLEDIERIEVIRGPGGTLWGANAVNGVINIETKNAEDTQGFQAVGGYGNVESGFGSLRIGGHVKDDMFYRAYIQGFDRSPGGSDANDDWSGGSLGFRGDWSPTDDDRFMLTMGITDVNVDEDVILPVPTSPFTSIASGSNSLRDRHILGRWTHLFEEDSELQLQLYYSQYRHESIIVGDRQDTYDIDFQHSFTGWDKHEIIWGARFRYHEDDFRNTAVATFVPDKRNDILYSAFLQDTIALDETFKLTLGTKLGYNSFTDFEFQPSIRAAWTPNDRQTVWAAASRAVRTPSRAEDDIILTDSFLPSGMGTIGTAFVGTRGYKSETLTAFEVGYRRQIGPNAHVDISTFYNLYDDLRTVRAGARTFYPQWPGVPFIPAFIGNEGDGKTYGVEIATDWYPRPEWLVRGTYSYLEVDLDAPPGALGQSDNDTPRHKMSITNQIDLPNNFEADATVRYVDEILNNVYGDYLELDLRLAWKPSESLELALVGMNLLDNGHFEGEDTIVRFVPTEVPRSVYLTATWEF